MKSESPLDKSMTPRTDALALMPLDPAVNPASARLTNALNMCAKLERELGAKQAQLDRLMLEFCPEEMTAEQTDEWAKHQRPASAVGPNEILWNLVDRAVKMFMLAVPDGEGLTKEDYNPIKAWLADATAALKNAAPQGRVAGAGSSSVGTQAPAVAAFVSPERAIYTPDQQRVANWIVKTSGNILGGGEDPIGFLLTSYEYLIKHGVPASSIRDGVTLTVEAGPQPNRYATFMLNGQPHRVCDCDPRKGPCARGFERTLLTTELSRCAVPDGSVRSAIHDLKKG